MQRPQHLHQSKQPSQAAFSLLPRYKKHWAGTAPPPGLWFHKLRLGSAALSPSRLLVGSSATKFSRPAAQHPAPIFGWPAAQKRQKAERADRRLPAHLLQGGRDLVLSLVGLSLSACRPPNFLGLRRSTHFGLPPAAQKAESRASRSGSTPSPPPSFKGGGVI